MNPDFTAFLEGRPYRSPITRDIHRDWLRRFEKWCSVQEIDWRHCQPADLERYHQGLLWANHSGGKMYSVNTVDQALRVLRHLYRWAHGHQLTTANPTSSWVLRRPPQPSQFSLSRAQVLRLFNLPDLATPRGLRDLLLLDMIYTLRLTLEQCRRVTVDWKQGAEIEASLAGYLRKGRPYLLRANTDILLVGNKGQPYTTDMGISVVLRGYAQRLELPVQLSARVLHRSAAENRAALGQRFRIPSVSATLYE